MKKLITIIFIIDTLLFFIWKAIPNVYPFQKKEAVSLYALNLSIAKAQKYYEGLYIDLGNKGAIVAEYYPKIKYTVRHATIGGIYYYDYIGDATKSAKLRKFVLTHGFNPTYDEHSFIWNQTSMAPDNIVYTKTTYHDCFVKLPSFGKITSYRSKVCSLGDFGVNLYIETTKHDSFVPMVNTLEDMGKGRPVDAKRFEDNYNQLGFGVPVCSPLGCSKNASTIRTAQLGEIELRKKNFDYADAIANSLVKAQNKNGAIYISFDENGKRDDTKSFAYHLLDMLFEDKGAYKGDIMTNAETMNDALAFLMHYRCEKYGVKCESAK